MSNRISDIKKHGFLFSELVKRDFKKKYKNTYLGMLWSLISPLLSLFVMSLVFTNFFGKTQPHYTIYIFSGNIIFSFFSDSTSGAMGALVGNADIYSKINVPKYLFLLSRNLSSVINFALTFAVFIIFTLIDGIKPEVSFFSLIIPVFCLIIFNLGIGLILSCLYVLFRDMQYLWGIFTMLLMYMSAIFYTLDAFSPDLRRLFYLNPIYVFISYFRIAVIEGRTPALMHNELCFFYAAIALLVGSAVYKKYDRRLIYYV